MSIRRLCSVCTTASITLTVVALWRRFLVADPQPHHYPYVFTFFVVLALNGMTIGLMRQEHWRVANACAIVCLVLSGMISCREFFG